MKNTASRLKQLGIIQLLLKNHELTKNTFLILDVTEINLHPEFQVKFAEILVLAVKKLNLTLYINTHSPFFCEAIEAYSKLYNLRDDTKFYLTQEFENTGKFNYNLIECSDIYDNFENHFDLIREINLKADI